jgi:hypothetical protein
MDQSELTAQVCQLDRVIQIALINLALLLVSCCGQGFQETTFQDVSAEVADFEIAGGDARIIQSAAQQEVWKYLPDAYLNAFVYTSRCDALSSVQGKFNMQFVYVDKFLFRHRYLTAFVSIDTHRGLMNIEYLDYTDLDLRTEGLTLGTDEIRFDEVARIAHDYISKVGASDCDVTITRTKQAWIVRCGPIDNFVQECLFEVDPWTGEIGPAQR